MDRQTDGIAVASTVLAMRALRHTVKKSEIEESYKEIPSPTTCVWPATLNSVSE